MGQVTQLDWDAAGQLVVLELGPCYMSARADDTMPTTRGI